MKNSAAKTSWILRIKKSYLPCDIVNIVRQLNMRTKKINWLFLIKRVFVQKKWTLVSEFSEDNPLSSTTSIFQ